jgi:hypothetical protein
VVYEWQRSALVILVVRVGHRREQAVLLQPQAHPENGLIRPA